MKRIVLCLLAVVVLLVGCTRLPADEGDASPTPDPPPYEAHWAYSCLSAEQQRNYGAVYVAVSDGFDTDSYVTVSSDEDTATLPGICVTLPVPLSKEDELRELYDAFMQDNPGFFHIGTVYGYDGRQQGEERSLTALKLTYTMTAVERLSARAALQRERDMLLSALSPSMTDFEVELALHDALTARCTYDTAAAESDAPLEQYAASFTVYGALVQGKAVCEGYARSMQYLLNAADISATVVTGYDSDGQPHMWNAVKPDGELYYVDATWNDTDDIRTYTYFNLNTEELLRSHRIDERTLGLEPAAATEQNYYRMTSSYLGTLRIEELAGHIAGCLAVDDTVHLRFTDAAFDNALFFVRSTAWFTDTVNACRPDGVAALGAYTFTYNETYKTVTISKKTS